MKDRYLEVTYRKGKPFAAYLHLPHQVGVRAVRTEPAADGLLVDFGPDDFPLGVEITAPTSVTSDQINAVLISLGLDPLDVNELAPLAA